jgi:hypothetical protein
MKGHLAAELTARRNDRTQHNGGWAFATLALLRAAVDAGFGVLITNDSRTTTSTLGMRSLQYVSTSERKNVESPMASWMSRSETGRCFVRSRCMDVVDTGRRRGSSTRGARYATACRRISLPRSGLNSAQQHVGRTRPRGKWPLLLLSSQPGGLP